MSKHQKDVLNDKLILQDLYEKSFGTDVQYCEDSDFDDEDIVTNVNQEELHDESSDEEFILQDLDEQCFGSEDQFCGESVLDDENIVSARRREDSGGCPVDVLPPDVSEKIRISEKRLNHVQQYQPANQTCAGWVDFSRGMSNVVYDSVAKTKPLETSIGSDALEVPSHKRGKNPYKCSCCALCFKSKGELTMHKRTHTQTGEKPFKCDSCPARFTQKGNLNVHKRTHTGEKPYKCPSCPARFAQRGNLDVHKRTHTGEKPYKCPSCDARFSRNDNLSSHKRIHTSKKPS